MTVRHLVSAHDLTDVLPDASKLSDATTSVIDGVTFVVRAGYWYRIDNDGQLPPTGPIPEASSPEERTVFSSPLTCSFVRPGVVDSDEYVMQASWFNYDGPLSYDASGTWTIGRSGFYAVSATLWEIDDISTDVDFAVVLVTMNGDRYTLATYRPLAGGMRTEQVLNGTPTGGANDVICGSGRLRTGRGATVGAGSLDGAAGGGVGRTRTLPVASELVAGAGTGSLALGAAEGSSVVGAAALGGGAVVVGGAGGGVVSGAIGIHQNAALVVRPWAALSSWTAKRSRSVVELTVAE